MKAHGLRSNIELKFPLQRHSSLGSVLFHMPYQFRVHLYKQ